MVCCTTQTRIPVKNWDQAKLLMLLGLQSQRRKRTRTSNSARRVCRVCLWLWLYILTTLSASPSVTQCLCIGPLQQVTASIGVRTNGATSEASQQEPSTAPLTEGQSARACLADGLPHRWTQCLWQRVAALLFKRKSSDQQEWCQNFLLLQFTHWPQLPSASVTHAWGFKHQ